VAEQYDLLLKGGTVIDPSQGLQQPLVKALSLAHYGWEVWGTRPC
jgi:hypothetical protein